MNKKIMIIDDDADQVISIKEKIESAYPDIEIEFILGYDGTFIKDYYLKNPPPNAIIIDYFMPVMNGYSTAKFIRKYWSKDVHIILITLDADLSDIKGQDYDLFDEFILKPITSKSITKALYDIIEEDV